MYTMHSSVKFVSASFLGRLGRGVARDTRSRLSFQGIQGEQQQRFAVTAIEKKPSSQGESYRFVGELCLSMPKVKKSTLKSTFMKREEHTLPLYSVASTCTRSDFDAYVTAERERETKAAAAFAAIDTESKGVLDAEQVSQALFEFDGTVICKDRVEDLIKYEEIGSMLTFEDFNVILQSEQLEATTSYSSSKRAWLFAGLLFGRMERNALRSGVSVGGVYVPALKEQCH